MHDRAWKAYRRFVLLPASILTVIFGLTALPPRAVHAQPGPQQDVVLLNYHVPQSRFEPGVELELLGLLNDVRRAHDLAPLLMDPSLRAAARAHSFDMAVHGYFGHNSWYGQSFVDRLAGAVRGGTLVGENVAVALDAQEVHTAFLASPGHRANILEPAFRRVGIGVATAGALGIMVTEDFSE